MTRFLIIRNVPLSINETTLFLLFEFALNNGVDAPSFTTGGICEEDVDATVGGTF
ncbi:hypothetical protein RO3G_09849 [Rhizopus delemar RA 99-880]|uniref:Uncharacterized protein n=1 Tax=Rhizopus delemar (strain RA 99-880 / ATCC MYA-4621 / FGSC 9543 / NRRL 43880) TaxID=246409 RepID=I1C9K9_RHIO9|nr:hypothetical protein RO3G_09849 [Rhizopus delemar RA 99-880]|eukprot:EIE85139.1 hypothetical protein RO3G_09849 [Rhizopus delemar RA 99-880]